MKAAAGSVPDELKIPKDAVGFWPPLPRGLQTRWSKGRTCGTCYYSYFARGGEQGGCFVVSGVIHRQSGCFLWNHTGVLRLDWEAGRAIAVRLEKLRSFLERIHRR